MYSIITICGGQLETVSTPSMRAAYRMYSAALRAGYITRLWLTKKGETQLIL
jgi:hypothetical protein